jgi:hypothetical protein
VRELRDHAMVAINAKIASIRDSHSRQLALRKATDQDLSAFAAIRSTERGIMQVGLTRVRRGSPHHPSPCDGAHYEYFAAQPVWCSAASLAGSAAIGRSAYY